MVLKTHAALQGDCETRYGKRQKRPGDDPGDRR
jgi:hypothetical protein